MIALDEIPPRLSRWCPPGARLVVPGQGETAAVVFAEGEGTHVVLKRCRDPRYLAWLRREHDVLRGLDGIELPVPRVLDYLEVEQGQPEIWLVTTRLPGSSLWPAMLDADATRRASLLAGVGGLLRRLHATEVPASLRRERSWIDRQLADAEANLAWCDGTPALLADLRHRRPPPVPETLIHGDLALGNLLVDADGVTCIVDWPMGGSGDPRCDVALALATEPELALTDRERDAFFEAYGSEPLDQATRRWFVDLYEFF